MRKSSMLAMTVGVLLALPAAAQSPAPQGAPEGTPTRVRGMVEKLDGQTLMVKSRDGQEVAVGLAPDFTVIGVAKRSLSDIKAGDYVASTSAKGADGQLHAIEIHIFPEAMRGAGEGQRPWDLVPDSLMTNATVSGVTAAPQGQLLKVTYKGGEAEVIVAPDTPIVTYVPGDANLLKPGAAIFTVAQKKADGSLTATRITAEKDGVKPPM
jgi:hypothetical protein